MSAVFQVSGENRLMGVSSGRTASGREPGQYPAPTALRSWSPPGSEDRAKRCATRRALGEEEHPAEPQQPPPQRDEPPPLLPPQHAQQFTDRAACRADPAEEAHHTTPAATGADFATR